MRNWHSLILSAICLTLLMPSIASGQGSLDQVMAALKAGNASALAAYFEANVELTIKDDEGAYSKAQAEQVVKNFFAKHPPKGFKKMHEGSSGSSQYAIGTLETANGSFRVDMFYKMTGNQLRIQRLKFTVS